MAVTKGINPLPSNCQDGKAHSPTYDITKYIVLPQAKKMSRSNDPNGKVYSPTRYLLFTY